MSEAEAKIKELLAHCRDQQQKQGRKDADVVYMIRGKWGDRTSAQLFGRYGGPRGRILTDTTRPGMLTCMFKADAIIADIERRMPMMPAVME